MLYLEPLQREQVKQPSSGPRPRFPWLQRAEAVGTRGQSAFRESDRQRQALSSQLEQEDRGSFSPSPNDSPSPRERPSPRGSAREGSPSRSSGAALRPSASCRLAHLAPPPPLSAPSKPRGRHGFARRGTETLEATEADFCFVWFVLCAQGCRKTKLDMKSPELFEEEKGLGACRAGFGGAGEKPAKKLLLSILKNGIIKWNRRDTYIMHK